MHRSNTVYKLKFWWISMREDIGNGFFHWRKRYYGLRVLARSDSLKLKCANDGFVSYKQLFASQDVN